jgi:hypothetical protein
MDFPLEIAINTSQIILLKSQPTYCTEALLSFFFWIRNIYLEFIIYLTQNYTTVFELTANHVTYLGFNTEGCFENLSTKTAFRYRDYWEDCSGFVFWRCTVQILAEAPAIHTAFVVIQAFQRNARIIPQLFSSKSLPSYYPQSSYHSTLYRWRYWQYHKIYFLKNT